jgi:hypothetical protein
MRLPAEQAELAAYRARQANILGVWALDQGHASISNVEVVSVPVDLV